MTTDLAEDGKPLDYQDENGTWWVMCACGHRVGGSPRPGDKIALCVNCRFIAGFNLLRSFVPVYPERVPENGMLVMEGDHPDHIKTREEMAKRKAKNERRKAKKLQDMLS